MEAKSVLLSPLKSPVRLLSVVNSNESGTFVKSTFSVGSTLNSVQIVFPPFLYKTKGIKSERKL